MSVHLACFCPCHICTDKYKRRQWNEMESK